MILRLIVPHLWRRTALIARNGHMKHETAAGRHESASRACQDLPLLSERPPDAGIYGKSLYAPGSILAFGLSNSTEGTRATLQSRTIDGPTAAP